MKRLLGIFLIASVVVGCSGNDRKLTYASVTGTVTFNGQPIAKGQITFALEGRPPSTIDIVDGKFDGQALVGSNKVSVSAKKKSGSAPKLNQDAQNQIKGYTERMNKSNGEFGSPPKDYDPSMVEYIPEEWSGKSTQMRVIESGSTNDLKIDIKGEAKK